MTAKELAEYLKNNNKQVYVKVENGLYYPITAIWQENGNIIIFCPDLNKGYKHW